MSVLGRGPSGASESGWKRKEAARPKQWSESGGEKINAVNEADLGLGEEKNSFKMPSKKKKYNARFPPVSWLASRTAGT